MPVDPIVAALVARRRWCNLGQAAVADMLGVSAGTVGFWEQGQTAPNLERLHEWAQALGVVVRAHEAAEVYADV